MQLPRASFRISHLGNFNRFLLSHSNLASILRTFRPGLHVFAQHSMICFICFGGLLFYTCAAAAMCFLLKNFCIGFFIPWSIQSLLQFANNIQINPLIACEYSRLSFAPATTCVVAGANERRLYSQANPLKALATLV